MMRLEELSAKGRRFFEMIEFDKDEELVCEIRKHPFGLFVILAIGAVVTVAVIIATIFAGQLLVNDPLETGANISRFSPLITIIGLVIAAFSILLTFVGWYIYTSSVVLVTSEKISQVLYQSIFNRKISQLSIGDIQDVTVKQVGIIARIFNFGTLVIETAGEQQNYTFTYTPDPYNRAKDIVGAHERNMTKYGN